MTTKSSDKLSLEIKRFINASPDRVYAAWTDPAQLKEWWGPESVRTRNLVADARVGGKYRWDLTNPEGEEMTVFVNTASSFRERRSSSPGSGMTTRIGKSTTASSRWSCPIATAALKCVWFTRNCQAKNHATVTTRAGTAFSIDW